VCFHLRVLSLEIVASGFPYLPFRGMTFRSRIKNRVMAMFDPKGGIGFIFQRWNSRE